MKWISPEMIAQNETCSLLILDEKERIELYDKYKRHAGILNCKRTGRPKMGGVIFE